MGTEIDVEGEDSKRESLNWIDCSELESVRERVKITNVLSFTIPGNLFIKLETLKGYFPQKSKLPLFIHWFLSFHWSTQPKL